MKGWDDNADGKVDRKEFKQHITSKSLLGDDVEDEALDQLFAACDLVRAARRSRTRSRLPPAISHPISHPIPHPISHPISCAHAISSAISCPHARSRVCQKRTQCPMSPLALPPALHMTPARTPLHIYLSRTKTATSTQLS